VLRDPVAAHSARRQSTQATAVRALTGPWSWLVDPTLRLVEVYQTINGLPALVTAAQDDERVVLPPFDLEMSLSGWWLPGPSPTE
jgi:hypothetical protein